MRAGGSGVVKIAYVCADAGVPVFGHKGCSIHVQEVLRTFVKRGWQVELIAASLGGPVRRGLDAVSVTQLPELSSSSPIARERTISLLNDAIRGALMKGTPFDLIYERHSLWSAAAMEFGRVAGIPRVLEVNAPLIEEQATYRELADRELAEGVARRAFVASSHIVVVSDAVADYVRQRDAPAEHIHIEPNGVDPTRFSPDIPPMIARQPGTITVGFAGSMKRWHGLLTLIDGFKIASRKCPALRLLIVGDGPLRQEIESTVQTAELDQVVRLVGPVDPERMPGMLTSMDIGVAPYDTIPGFYFSPLKIFEYMAAGLPVVASATGQIPEIIQDGERGLLSRPGDADNLALTLVRLAGDSGLRARLGTSARAAAVRQYTWDAIVDRVVAAAFEAAQPREVSV